MAAGRPWAAVPADLAEAVRPRLHEVVPAVIAEIRAEVPEYDQPLEGEFGRLISVGVERALEQFVELLGRDEDVPDLATSEALGRAEHRAGRTLDALQSAYRVGARVAWRAAAAWGAEAGADPQVMYRAAEAIFVYIDRLAAASVAGYAQEASMRAGSLQARRHALVELLVRAPPPEPDELARAADAAGWPVPEAVAVLATGDADPVALARRMPPGTVGAALEPVGLLVVPDPDGPGQAAVIEAALRGQRAALGPTVAAPHARRSADRARAAWALQAAGRLGDRALVRAGDHLLELVLAADAALAQELADRRLAPLRALARGARERALDTLAAWLDAHGDVSATAEALHVHPQTVRYRLGTLREVLGPALDDPRARLELALALRVYAATASDGAGAPAAASSASAGASAAPPGSA